MMETIQLEQSLKDFAVKENADYIYAESTDGGQCKIGKSKLMEIGGLFKFYGTIESGKSIILPYDSGFITVQCASNSFAKACAVLCSNNRGPILAPESNINFFSEKADKICVLNTGNNSKYIVKNTFNIGIIVSVTFIA